MQDIILQHEKDTEVYNYKLAQIESERAKIEARIERANKALADLERKENALFHPSRYDLIDALAEKLSKHYELDYKIYGPFGLECETSIYLFKNPKVSICEQDTISITLRPFGDGENDWIMYQTDEKLNRYERGTIGEMNGYNDVYAPLPKDLSEIIKLMRVSKKEE